MPTMNEPTVVAVPTTTMAPAQSSQRRLPPRCSMFVCAASLVAFELKRRGQVKSFASSICVELDEKAVERTDYFAGALLCVRRRVCIHAKMQDFFLSESSETDDKLDCRFLTLSRTRGRCKT